MKSNNILKVGILLVVLAVPAFVFIFLKTFGENKFSLQVLNPNTPDCPNYQKEGIHRIPPFRFVSQDGKTITNETFAGKVYVADFFFTRCPSICLDMSKELVRVQENFKDHPEVKILSHSVDPGYDSVQILKTYANHYKADPNIWTFVTGNQKDIYEMARCGYYIPVQKGANGEVDFVHSDKFILVDKEGRIRGYYSGTQREDVDRLITEIQILLKEN